MLIELCTCANRAVRSCVHVLIELLGAEYMC